MIASTQYERLGNCTPVAQQFCLSNIRNVVSIRRAVLRRDSCVPHPGHVPIRAGPRRMCRNPGGGLPCRRAVGAGALSSLGAPKVAAIARQHLERSSRVQ